MTSSPEMCGFYSITADGRYEESTSSLQYFFEPKLPINLNKNISLLNTIFNDYDKMGHVLNFMANHKYECLNNLLSTHHGKQYITYRGCLRIIIRSRVNKKSWTIIACRYKNKIYLYEYKSTEMVKQKPILQNVIFKYRRMFKYHCMSDSPCRTSGVPKFSEESKKIFCVFKTNLLGREILLSAQMDGIESETLLNPENFRQWKLNQFVNISVVCESNSRKRMSRFENEKLLDLWAFMFPIGAGKVQIGFRDDCGILKEMRSYSFDELEEAKERHWEDSMDVLGFLDFFLGKVENDLEDTDCPYTTVRYDYDPKTKSVFSTKYDGRSDYSCLPEWYLDEINN